MTMDGRPKIRRALSVLMDMLDREVGKAFFVTSHCELEGPAVEEAEQYLVKEPMSDVQGRAAHARQKVQSALREWLVATDELNNSRDSS